MVDLFARLISNENGWTVPSGHEWRVNNQGNSQVAYEHQYGFGHEEWLLNPRYRVGHEQYGHIRSLEKTSFHNDGFIDIVHFYSLRPMNGRSIAYYVGFIKNVHLLNINTEADIDPVITQLFNSSLGEAIAEVNESGGDSSPLNINTFYPIARFKMEDVLFFQEPLTLEGFPLDRFSRYQAHNVSLLPKDYFDQFFLKTESKDFVFTPGKANSSESYNRSNSKSEKAVHKYHKKIIDALEGFLISEYTVLNGTLSIEKQKFDLCIADLVGIEKDGSISIFEVKTTASARKNIRDAIGQLLDYASHAKNAKINKLVIVSPCDLTRNEIDFFKSLKSMINYPLIYLYFNDGNLPVFIQHD